MQQFRENFKIAEVEISKSKDLNTIPTSDVIKPNFDTVQDQLQKRSNSFGSEGNLP